MVGDRRLEASQSFHTMETYMLEAAASLLWSHATSMIGQVLSISTPSHQLPSAVFDPRSDVLNMYKEYDVFCGRA